MFDRILFGNRINALRKAKNLTQNDLATVLGVTKTQISDLENGKTATTLEKCFALADYFDVSLDYLVGRSDNPRRR